jgi:hypothetical protein
MDFVVNALEDVGIVGQLLLLYFLLRGPLRRYYLIFIYTLAETAATYADKYAIRSMGRQSTEFHNVYFGGEVSVDLLLFVVVILFTYQVMEDSPMRAKVRKILAAIAASVIVLPFVLISGDWFSTKWYNGTIQLFNFGAAVMTLALWTALIARKARSQEMMLVCAGLGVAVAGSAVAWGMRKFTSPGSDARTIANLLIQVMYLVKLGIWCWAFRPQHSKLPPALQPTSSLG